MQIQMASSNVVHYERAPNRDAGGSLDEYNAEQMTLYSTEETAAAGTKIEKTDNGITFTVDSFSPFAVYYTAKADTPDTPDNPAGRLMVVTMVRMV